MTTMENKEDILKKLGSEEIQLRQEALAAVKNEGDITIVPALLDILTTAKDHKTTEELVNLLADIKDNAFPQIVIDRNDPKITVIEIMLGISTGFLSLHRSLCRVDSTGGFHSCPGSFYSHRKYP